MEAASQNFPSGAAVDGKLFGCRTVGMEKNGLLSIATLEPPAPGLLQLVSCKCQTDCQRWCEFRQAVRNCATV